MLCFFSESLAINYIVLFFFFNICCSGLLVVISGRDRVEYSYSVLTRTRSFFISFLP